MEKDDDGNMARCSTRDSVLVSKENKDEEDEDKNEGEDKENMDKEDDEEKDNEEGEVDHSICRNQ